MDNQSAATQIELLQPAIENGDTTKILQFLQQNDVDVTAVNDIGDTVLHLILRSVKFAPRLSPIKIIEIMDIFIGRGVDPNIKNKNQETALHLAIAPQLKDVVDYLLKHKSNINVVDDKGNSVAHYFIGKLRELFKEKKYSKSCNTHVHEYAEIAKKDDSSFVEWLISRGIDVDLKNEVGLSALHLAIEFNMQHILVTLLKHTRDIHFVFKIEKQNLLYLFLKTIYVNDRWTRRRATFKADYRPPHQFEACVFFQESGYQSILPLFSQDFPSEFSVEIVQILLERGVSVDLEDKDGLTPLHFAIRNNVQMPIVLMMLDRLINMSDELTVTLFHEIIKTKTFSSPRFDYFKVLDILTTKVININVKDANGKSCLYHVVEYDDLKALELLKKRGALDFSVLTNNGEILLHALTVNGALAHPDLDVIFNLLISEGCDVRAKNREGQTPLHWAALRRNFAVAQKLIAHGADVNCQDYEKELSPLHEAINRGSVELMGLLLDNGANVNAKSREGRPLHLVTHSKARNLLLKYKPEVNARDHRGDTALAKFVHANTGRNFISFIANDELQDFLEHGPDINDASVIPLLPRCKDELKYESVGKILVRHSVKLRTAELPSSDEYQTHVVVDQEYEQMREGCLREIEIMKRTFIDTRTSLYGWLHMDPNRRHVHSYNEKLQKIIDLTTIKVQFPQYSTVILATYRETLARKSLLEPAKKAWLELTGIHLPDICLERIFAYLNTGDMFEMAEILDEN